MEMNVQKIVDTLERTARFHDRVEHVAVLPGTDPAHGEVEGLSDPVQDYILKKGITLYSHQVDAVKRLRAGKNVIITTPTASGKTLAFTIPIFERLHTVKSATALLVYPTKALSHDQLKELHEFERLSSISVNPQVYDGDTPRGRRPHIRETSRIIISNPYELHHVLPWHYKWQKFFGNLAFLVIDEAHKYRGVFGSNVAFLLRRLQRILDFYNAHPQVILSTATLANPVEFGENLVGVPFDLVDADGSPRGKKYFVFYNPYYDGAGTLSTHQETKDLFLYYVRNNLQTLCFTVSRKMAELITMWSKKETAKEEPHLTDRITAYRAGYLPGERRDIENKLKDGILKGVTSTNALELGIDIGSLDSVIISGYPGTVISTWQQAGRAGRGIDESVVTLVAFQNPLDQYFMHHPDVFFGKPHEHAIIDLKNPYIVSGHIMCAAAELPVKKEDETYFGNIGGILQVLEIERLICNTEHGWVYTGSGGRATEAVQLDTISSDIFKVVCGGELLETMDRPQAYREAHQGAVLLHQGEPYVVEDLDLKNGIAYVKKSDVDYYTEALKVVDITVLEELEKKEMGTVSISFGSLKVTEEYTGYRIIKYDTVVGIQPLDLPALTFRTLGLWITVPESMKEVIWEKRRKDSDIKELLRERSEKDVQNDLFAGGLHGAEHALIGVMPFHVMCDRWDIGGVSTIRHPDTAQPTVFVYDGFEGGIGLTERAFELIGEVVTMACELVQDCTCETGCPACIYSPKCGNDNRPLDKKGTVLILEQLQPVITLQTPQSF
jgi:DEAD/DEAH box helicase domain-containing protein